MTDTIAVVREAQAMDEAYAMGYRRFATSDEIDDPERALEGFRDGAKYANHVLPTLRCLAGYDDSGAGTWTLAREVALVADGDESDHPADAELVDSSRLHEQLVDEWHRGAYAALENAPKSQEADV